MPKYSVKWKITLNGKAAITGSVGSVDAKSESEAIAKVTKQVRSQHQGNFKKGYEISEIIATPK